MSDFCGEKEILKYLHNRGLSLSAIEQYKIGWSNKNYYFPRPSWGLSEQSDPDGIPVARFLWIPGGIVIPSLNSNGEVMRLKVRRWDWQEGDKLPKYVIISKSMNGLTLIGSSINKVMVVVESDLDAYAMVGAVEDFVTIVAVGGNTKNPDNVTDRLARQASRLLICHDNDDGGKKMLAKWQEMYSHAMPYPTPIGKDIGEAIQKDFNIREWLLRMINP